MSDLPPAAGPAGALRPGATARALAGALALALAIGIGRFGYTALLPSLQRGVGFDDASAGAIASANLLGYLAGALWARGAGARAAPVLLRLGLAASVATTALAAWGDGWTAWMAVRLAAGVASGLVFVLASAAVLHALPPERAGLAGLLYSGVGAGMALAGAVAVAAGHASWRTPWLVLAAAAAAMALLPWRWLHAPVRAASPAPAPAGRAAGSLRRLGLAYFFEGLGYIVSGTFAVAAAQRTASLSGLAPWVWVAAGLAAAPSAPLWAGAARVHGERRALAAAFFVQVLGMSLPALSAHPLAAFGGALLFGGTFMGIATLTMAAARRLDPHGGPRTVGTLTVVYGVGQAAGPLLAGALSRRLGDPRPAVLAASAAVLLGGLLLLGRER